MSVGPFEYERSGPNRAALSSGETMLDELLTTAIPKLTRQSERTLDALGEARQRQADRRSVRHDLRGELKARRDRGLR